MTEANIVNEPQQMSAAFANAFNSGNISNLLSLFDDQAQMVTQNGDAVTGHDAIAEQLNGFLSLGGQMAAENVYAYVQGDTALLRGHWKLTAKNEDGSPLEIEGHTSEVVKKQADGRWLYIIDHPFGAS